MLNEETTLRDLLIPPCFDDDAEADSFVESCNVKSGLGYEWYCEYAKEDFARACANGSELDARADAIIRSVGLFTGVVSAAALFQVNATTWWVAVAFGPSLLCAIAAIVLATAARVPALVLRPPSTTIALSFVNSYEEKSQA